VDDTVHGLRLTGARGYAICPVAQPVKIRIHGSHTGERETSRRLGTSLVITAFRCRALYPHYGGVPAPTRRKVPTVKVVFLETVEGSGAMGDIRDVANGFARNYLLPRGYAAPATPQLLEQAAELAQIEGERQRVEDERAHGLVGKLEIATLVMTVRVGEQGRLYGSVTSADIAEKAGEILGEELDRRRVLLPEVIRNVGLFPVTLRLSRNIATEVNVAVVDAEAPEGVDAAVEQLLAPPVMEEPEPEATPTEEESDVTETADVSEQGKNELDGDETSAEASADTSDASDDPASTDDAEAVEADSDAETEEAVTE